mgnify:CR=1 FL=1
MESVKTFSTPLSMHVNLSKSECSKSVDEKEFMSKIPYSYVFGSLMYIMIATRPIGAFAMRALSIFLSTLVRNIGK